MRTSRIFWAILLLLVSPHVTFAAVPLDISDEVAIFRDAFVASNFSSVDELMVNCGRYIFYFGVAGGRYQLVEFAADPAAAP